MKIHYLKQSNNKKLFSFHRHDYKKGENDTFIDGGFDYQRYNGEIEEGEISELIKDIREQFTWGTIYEKDGKTLRRETKWVLLKDLETDHIIAILINFTKILKGSMNDKLRIYTLFFLHELKYRNGEN